MRLSSLKYFKQNITQVSSYALLDWLESHFKMEIHENDKLHFKGSVSLSSPPNDLGALEGNLDSLYVTFNNVGLIGVQGGMALYVVEEILRREQLGDRVLMDFVDIFNHRVVETLYKLRKVNHIHYYSTHVAKNMLDGLLDIEYYGATSFKQSKYKTVAYICGLIRQIFGNEVECQINKARNRKMRVNKPLVLDGNRLLHNAILGKECILNDLTEVKLTCLTWDSFERLIYLGELSKLEQITLLSGRVKFVVSLRHDAMRKAKLGTAKLSGGVVL